MQVEGTEFEQATVKANRSNVDMEKERARYQKDLRDVEYTISQTRSKYQSESPLGIHSDYWLNAPGSRVVQVVG